MPVAPRAAWNEVKRAARASGSPNACSHQRRLRPRIGQASARDSLGKEHAAGADFYAQIGERYKRESVGLGTLLADAATAGEHDLAPGFAILDRRDGRLAAIADELRHRDAAGMLSPPLARFAWSLVHMHANRLLHASARAQELVIYDLLRRLHRSRRARGR